VNASSIARPRRMRAAGLALLALAGAALMQSALAQPYPTPPEPAAPRPLSVQPPVEQKLPNGLRIVLAERPGVGLVSAQLIVLSGSETDPANLPGLAAMTATLLTKGTREHSATSLATAAEALGTALSSGAGWNQSSVGVTVAEPNLDAALDLVAEVVTQPTFAQDELDRARAQALDDLKVAYAQPGALAGAAADRLLFGAAPYGHPAGGTPASLPRIARPDLLKLHQAHYRPDNAVLVLAGDLDAAQARRLAAKHFGGWRASGKAAEAPSAAASASGSLNSSLAVIDMPQSGQAGVVLVTPAPPARTDRAIGQVANAVLGGDYSSRLNQEIRVKRGLSYGANSRLDARRQAGSFRAGVQTKNESAIEVVGLLQAEFDRLIDTPVPADELAARKATLIGTFSRSVETTAGLAGTVGALVVIGVPPDDLGRLIDALQAVTAADIQRYAKTWFAPERRRVVVAGDAAKFADALKKTAPELRPIPLGSLDLEKGDGLSR